MTWNLVLSYSVTYKYARSVLVRLYSQKLQSYYTVRRFMHFSMQHDSDPILTSESPRWQSDSQFYRIILQRTQVDVAMRFHFFLFIPTAGNKHAVLV